MFGVFYFKYTYIFRLFLNKIYNFSKIYKKKIFSFIGGASNDFYDKGQDMTDVLGSIVRIDVDSTPDAGKAYAVPSSECRATSGAHIS